jgi:hypothetical protein
MALSLGNLELVRICWERLPDEQEKERLDLLEVAADFHQLEVLSWLFRNADKFAKELFVGFAIHRHLADVLLAVLGDGFRPWWAVGAGAKWTPMREFVFGPAPKGLWPDGGWFTISERETKGIRAMEGKWARELTESELGDENQVTEVVLPRGVTAIAGDAFRGDAAFAHDSAGLRDDRGRDGTRRLDVAKARWPAAHLSKAMIPVTCATIGAFAHYGCSGLRDLAFGSSVTTIGDEAFFGCSGLAELVIPSSVTTIGDAAFLDCLGLKALTISASLAGIGDGDRDVFYGMTLERVTLVGSPLDPAVIANVEPALAPGATVISAALAGQRFGRFAIAAA